MQKYLYFLRRALGYVIGFLLFYEPFSFFYKLVSPVIPEVGFTTLHVPCVRIPLATLLTGNYSFIGPISLFFCLLLFIISILLGPLFCGYLCPAGAFGELLSQLVPEKWQIDWSRHLPVLPLRYGFFLGFLCSLLLGLGLPCTYCNYYAFELFVHLLYTGKLITTSVSLLGTFFLAYVVFGIWTKGGRGYCLFLCPVGTAQTLLHYLGSFLPGTFRMRTNRQACIGCGKCVRNCPMRAITLKDRKAVINIHQCITCGQCAHHCPKQAISYSCKEVSHEQ